mgnify:CR=1 FL=1
MSSSKKTVEEIVDANFKYFGEARLQTFGVDDLRRMLTLYNTKHLELSDSSCTSKDEMIAEILKLKSKRVEKSPLSKDAAAKKIQFCLKEHVQQKSSVNDEFVHVDNPNNVHTLPDGEVTKLVPSGEDGIALEITIENKPTSTRVIKERHALRIVAFNSLKLRVGKEGLAEQWIGLVATLATFDVVVLSEVPAEVKVDEAGEIKRSDVFLWLLSHHSGDEWHMYDSEPCGPGNLEKHVVFARTPIRVLSCLTHFNARGVTLDHAPFSVLLMDDRFEQECNKRWVITSVHFPPKSKANERDTQLAAFLETYAQESSTRLETPFTPKGAKDAKQTQVHHVICGDLNCYPDKETFRLEAEGYAEPLLGEHVSTSSGGSSYDNFIVSKHTESSLTLNREVLELELMAKGGVDGLSDHSPIALVARETRVVKKKK